MNAARRLSDEDLRAVAALKASASSGDIDGEKHRKAAAD